MRSSETPYLVQDVDQDQHQSAPNNYNYLLTIVSDDGYIVLDVWIAIEKFVSPAEDENAAKQKNDRRESECDAQRRNARLFNHRYHQGNIRFHGNRLPTLSIRCCDTSVGFSDATEGGIATPSSEVNAANDSFAFLASSLVPFRGENRFRIGAGNFAHRNPAKATNQRDDQK
jgi:hypothetical protein